MPPHPALPLLKKLTATAFLAIIMLSCNTAADKPLHNFPEKIQEKAVRLPNSLTAAKQITEEDNDCTRGAAEPVIKKSVYPHATFTLLGDKVNGIETVTLNNGDVLTINNTGCESYVLRFRFETARFSEPVTDVPFWYKQAATLMTELLPALDVPIDIKEPVDKLVSHIDAQQATNDTNLKVGDEINYDTNGMPKSITLEKLEQLPGKKVAVTVTVIVGPL